MKTNTGLPFVTYTQNHFKVGYLIFCGTELFFFCLFFKATTWDKWGKLRTKRISTASVLLTHPVLLIIWFQHLSLNDPYIKMVFLNLMVTVKVQTARFYLLKDAAGALFMALNVFLL